MLKGIRGATTVESNTKPEILLKTKELLLKLTADNKLEIDKIASVFLTMTEDLNACFPAEAARSMGWTEVPLLCAREIDVQNSLKSCIRVLIHYNTNKDFKAVPTYLHKAVSLRKDLKQ